MHTREDKGLFQTDSGNREEINIKALLLKYLQYWYWFVGSVILCFTAAFIHQRYNTLIQYHINSTLLIKDEQNGSDLLGGTAGLGVFNNSKKIENEIVILKSKSLMHRVLSELSLHTTYYIEGRIRDMEVYKDDIPIELIFSSYDSLAFGKSVKIRATDKNTFDLIEESGGEKSISTHKFGQEIKTAYATFTAVSSAATPPSQTYIIRFHDLRQLAESYSRKLMIQPVNDNTSILNVSLVDAVSQRGIDIIDKLVEVYNQEGIEDKNQMAVNSLQFLDERLSYLSEELSDVEKNVEQYKQRNNLTDVSSNAQLYLQKASEYNEQLEGYELQIDILNSIEAYLQKDDMQLVPSSLNIQDPTLNSLIAKFNELQQERQRMLRTIQPESSLILNIDDQLANLRVNIMENLSNIKNGLIITRDNLQASSSRFESRIQKVPSIERELLEINRQQSIKQQIYLYLLQKREESALALASATPNTRIIDRAVAYPIYPNKANIYLASILLGLFLPFAFQYIKEMLDDKVQELKDVQKITATPVLGEISHSKLKDTLVVTKKSYTPTAELFRLIRANLQFATIGKENKVILITSSISGEGKTFFSINLGASLALAGKRVVVVNFDLRKPTPNQNIGLTNYLVNENFSVDNITVSHPSIPGLAMIGSGLLPPNPAELIMSENVARLIAELKVRFDYVLIDSSPVGQVADPYALAPLIDSCIYIVRCKHTQKSQLEIIDDIYRNQKFKHPMIVLNDTKKDNSYGYGYSYEKMNGNEVKSKKRKASSSKGR
ncbi:polysaccharide biosynthesis tyrosine autokinase [Catalinimonas sp. 4WD22]|uniref:GumC family protein n=1 Tax=Catalinimonas locisalis TaxID=3133978 RepID=UPI0031014573